MSTNKSTPPSKGSYSGSIDSIVSSCDQDQQALLAKLTQLRTQREELDQSLAETKKEIRDLSDQVNNVSNKFSSWLAENEKRKMDSATASLRNTNQNQLIDLGKKNNDSKSTHVRLGENNDDESETRTAQHEENPNDIVSDLLSRLNALKTINQENQPTTNNNDKQIQSKNYDSLNKADKATAKSRKSNDNSMHENVAQIKACVDDVDGSANPQEVNNVEKSITKHGSLESNEKVVPMDYYIAPNSAEIKDSANNNVEPSENDASCSTNQSPSDEMKQTNTSKKDDTIVSGNDNNDEMTIDGIIPSFEEPTKQENAADDGPVPISQTSIGESENDMETNASPHITNGTSVLMNQVAETKNNEKGANTKHIEECVLTNVNNIGMKIDNPSIEKSTATDFPPTFETTKDKAVQGVKLTALEETSTASSPAKNGSLSVNKSSESNGLQNKIEDTNKVDNVALNLADSADTANYTGEMLIDDATKESKKLSTNNESTTANLNAIIPPENAALSTNKNLELSGPTVDGSAKNTSDGATSDKVEMEIDNYPTVKESAISGSNPPVNENEATAAPTTLTIEDSITTHSNKVSNVGNKSHSMNQKFQASEQIIIEDNNILDTNDPSIVASFVNSKMEVVEPEPLMRDPTIKDFVIDGSIPTHETTKGKPTNQIEAKVLEESLSTNSNTILPVNKTALSTKISVEPSGQELENKDSIDMDDNIVINDYVKMTSDEPDMNETTTSKEGPAAINGNQGVGVGRSQSAKPGEQELIKRDSKGSNDDPISGNVAGIDMATEDSKMEMSQTHEITRCESAADERMGATDKTEAHIPTCDKNASTTIKEQAAATYTGSTLRAEDTQLSAIQSSESSKQAVEDSATMDSDDHTSKTSDVNMKVEIDDPKPDIKNLIMQESIENTYGFYANGSDTVTKTLKTEGGSRTSNYNMALLAEIAALSVYEGAEVRKQCEENVDSKKFEGGRALENVGDSAFSPGIDLLTAAGSIQSHENSNCKVTNDVEETTSVARTTKAEVISAIDKDAASRVNNITYSTGQGDESIEQKVENNVPPDGDDASELKMKDKATVKKADPATRKPSEQALHETSTVVVAAMTNNDTTLLTNNAKLSNDQGVVESEQVIQNKSSKDIGGPARQNVDDVGMTFNEANSVIIDQGVSDSPTLGSTPVFQASSGKSVKDLRAFSTVDAAAVSNSNASLLAKNKQSSTNPKTQPSNQGAQKVNVISNSQEDKPMTDTNFLVSEGATTANFNVNVSSSIDQSPGPSGHGVVNHHQKMIDGTSLWNTGDSGAEQLRPENNKPPTVQLNTKKTKQCEEPGIEIQDKIDAVMVMNNLGSAGGGGEGAIDENTLLGGNSTLVLQETGEPSKEQPNAIDVITKEEVSFIGPNKPADGYSNQLITLPDCAETTSFDVKQTPIPSSTIEMIRDQSKDKQGSVMKAPPNLLEESNFISLETSASKVATAVGGGLNETAEMSEIQIMNNKDDIWKVLGPYGRDRHSDSESYSDSDSDSFDSDLDSSDSSGSSDSISTDDLSTTIGCDSDDSDFSLTKQKRIPGTNRSNAQKYANIMATDSTEGGKKRKAKSKVFRSRRKWARMSDCRLSSFVVDVFNSNETK